MAQDKVECYQRRENKMAKDLETKPNENWLRELGVFSLKTDNNAKRS